MAENFIRVFDSPLNKEQSKLLIKEFDEIEGKASLRLNLDGTEIGETAYIEGGSDAESLLVRYVSNLIGDCISELGVPYHFKNLTDEGYQIQRWDSNTPHWISTIDESRVLQILIVLGAKRGTTINFRHHGPHSLRSGKALVFPTLYTHSYMLELAKGVNSTSYPQQ